MLFNALDALRCKYVFHRKSNIIYEPLVLMSNLTYSIHLFDKYVFSGSVAILGIADTAVSNIASPALVQLIF